MAFSNSLIMQKISGQLGKEVVFKQFGNKTVVTKYPDMSKRVLSEKQKRVNAMMAEANYEAKRIIADEELRNLAQIRLNTTRKRLYHALVREYFKSAMEEIKKVS